MNKYLHDFVMKTLKEMIDKNVEEYRVRQYALGWYEKQVLEQEDLMQIDRWYEEKAEAIAEAERLAREEAERLAQEQTDIPEEFEDLSQE